MGSVKGGLCLVPRWFTGSGVPSGLCGSVPAAEVTGKALEAKGIRLKEMPPKVMCKGCLW